MKPTKKIGLLKKRKSSTKKPADIEENEIEQVQIEENVRLNEEVPESESGDKEEMELDEVENDEEEEETPTDDAETKQRKSGVVYFTMIPPKYNVKRMREYFERIAPGQIGRIFLARNKHSKSGDNRYSEGWMELKKKKIAKTIAEQIDNTQIGGKTKDYVSSMYWNIRYLSGFKWVHLMEQMQFEKEVEKRRMNVEISQAKRIAAHFEESIEKGKHLKKLEQKVKSQGGKWSEFERDVQQTKTLKKARKDKQKSSNTDNNELMNMIFK